MHNRIDAVAGSAPGRLLPVDSIQSQRKAQDDHAGLERREAPAVSFSSREDSGVNAYAPPAEVVATRSFVTPDPVAPALAEALAAEPWGHPMPQKAVWEQAAAARERLPEPEPVEAAVTIVASTATAPAAPASSAPAATPIATSAAAPATPAAVASAGSAAPVSPAWLTSLLKAR